MILVQGDSYPVWIDLQQNGEALSPGTAGDVTVRVGDLLQYRYSEGELGFDRDRGKWYFTPTAAETAGLAPESYRVTVEVSYRNRPQGYNRVIPVGTIFIQEGATDEALNAAAMAGLSGSISGKMIVGVSGVTFTPKWDGSRLSWENDGGLDNPTPMNLVQDVIQALPKWTGGSY